MDNTLEQDSTRIVSSKDLKEELSKAPEQNFFRSGYEYLDEAIGGWAEGDLVIMGGSQKAGKCFGKGTEIIMADGSIKEVENIKTGDKVMGEDSQPRKVLGCNTGRAEMYEITLSNGDTFTCNGEHILVLKREKVLTRKRGSARNGEIVEITLKEYLKKSDTWKRKYRMYKTGINYKPQPLLIEPYFLGLWLGDGNTGDVGVTTADKEVVDYLYLYADKLNLKITVNEQGGKGKAKTYSITNQKHKGVKHGTSLQGKLGVIGVRGNKHIPNEYLFNSRDNRLKLLAGLIDSDGYSGGRSQIVFSNKNLALCEQVLYLAGSLGFQSTLRRRYNKQYNKYYYYVGIGGDVKEIPLLLKRKYPNIPISYTKQRNIFRFDVKSIGIGDYYGFEVDGNGRFLLGNFIVTHNSTFLQTLTKRFAKNDIPCLWFSIEMSNRELLSRFGDDLPVFHLPRVMPSGSTISWIEKKIVEAKKAHGVKIVFIDHLGMISDEATAGNRNEVSILDARLMRLKRFAIQEKICIIAVATFALTSTRRKSTTPTTGDFRGTAMLGYTADTLLAIDRLAGGNKMTTLNEEFSDVDELKGGLLIPSDAYLYILDCRRTGTRKVRIRVIMNEEGDLEEWHG